MARINNLSNFLTDIANAIRIKKRTSNLIPAEDFDTEIESITTGGDMQSKSIAITENGTRTITPDMDYDGLSSVSITTNVAGGTTGDFQYNNWIAYGVNSPSVNDYNYWLPVPTTPTNAPLKQVSGYKKDTYFTGDIENLVDSSTASNYYSSYIKPLDVAYYNGIYYYCSQAVRYSQTVSRYTYSNQNYPMADITSTSTSTSGMDRSATIRSLLVMTPSSSQQMSYGAWLIEDGIFYFFETVYISSNGNDKVEYRSLSGGSTTYLYCGKNYLALENQKNRSLGLFKIDSTHFILLMYNTASTSTLKVYKLNCATSSSGTSSTLLQSYTMSGAANYGCKKLDSNAMLIAPNGTSSYSTSTYYVKVFNPTDNSSYNITYPSGATSFTCTYLIPSNKLVYRFNNELNKLYEITKVNGTYQFTDMNIGNICGGIIRQGLNALLYMNISSNLFRARCDRTMTFEYNGTTYSATFENATQQTNTISYQVDKSAVIETKESENINSTDNVLLISNYQNNMSNIHYKFYPKQDSNIFLPALRDYTNGAIVIYRKNIYTIYVSKDGQWISSLNDNSNYIT